MLRNGHVRFGGRAAETHQPQGWQGAAARPYTYCRTWAGFTYVAFIVDVYAQRIVAWHASTRKETNLVMIPLRMALWQRDREGQPITAGELIHHSDAGSQGGFNRSSQHLDPGGVRGDGGLEQKDQRCARFAASAVAC